MSYKGMHPGIYLRHAIMEPLAMRVSNMAKVLSLSESAASQFLSGQRTIDASIAERLGVFFDMTPSFWLDMQRACDEAVHEQRWRDRLVRSTERALAPAATMRVMGAHPAASQSLSLRHSGASAS